MAIKNKEDLLFKSIDEISQLYRSKVVSPVEVLEATLELQRELEPRLNAFITVMSEAALNKAREAEKAFVKGEAAGKLVGVPVSIKDIFMTKGIRTTIGSRILQDFVPEGDSHIYEALQKAGAIVFGKTNMLEFAYGSVHPDYGQCNNPWDVTRTAGGSSSGSASSVAAGIGFASIGTDTGGSIRLPSSFCGIVGLKPTTGQVSSSGLFPLSHSFDHIGPMTRTVRDNAIVLESISSKPGNFESIFTGSIKGTKIGVIRSLIDSLTHHEVEEIINSAINRLSDLGAEIIEIEIPEISNVKEFAFPILLSEASYYHQKWYPDRSADYANGTLMNIKEGFNISAVSYLDAIQKKREFTEKVNSAFEGMDFLVCPTSPSPATKRDPSFEDTEYDFTERTLPFNVSGHPAITVSAGQTPSGNLPVGLQFLGRHNDEASIYNAADVFQSASGGYKHPSFTQLNHK
ncbi:amidase [Fictibacillus sp. WQ 8-8]|uniref:amidase n=1 Tax=Fictibacillus sp. WQ 8-8 TaxID=2938788 RepID=UPI00210DEE37|nr:amidase [Fictibacillus sp. WQ 8-8]MCQ6268357.1 amidase [Fictibacillus sp. WQ 8-8]